MTLFDEKNSSHQPALDLLQTIGWKYLPPEEVLSLRKNNTSEVLLETVLWEQLKNLNSVFRNGEIFEFSDANLREAILTLKSVPRDGLLRENEMVYNILTLGKSFEQTLGGDKKSYSLHYIDWQHPENNIYHVTEEFTVQRSGTNEHYRPDIVLFVNGIPLVVIECKRPNLPDGQDPLKQAISQHLRNQKTDGIQQLFQFSQILLAVSGDQAKYGTVGTAENFWRLWKERNTPDFLQTEQDKLIWSLCRPERLFDLIRRFILVDGGIKKIAQYQQYFCATKILDRIKRKDENGQRPGGVVWHTQGSGKSLTMVFLARALVLEPDILNYRIVLVTDRIDLDEQIKKTFANCGVDVRRATSGNDLVELLRNTSSTVITTVIDKFEAAAGKQGVTLNDPDIFVLVDESHRTQYGLIHAKMKKTLPQACYIGFTGTPVLQKEKNTVVKFGGIIDAYPLTQAVDDGAVVPLLYEGRDMKKSVNQPDIDLWFERETQGLTDEQKADLKKKYSRSEILYRTEPVIKAIAWDIQNHFVTNWQGTPFKAQLIAPSKSAALCYKKFFDEWKKISTEVLISAPDTREGNISLWEENKIAVNNFWKHTVGQSGKYSTEKEYNRIVIDNFKNGTPDNSETNVELIIVVDKLLTGFDAPRNTILYLAKSLRDHSLLQAIARVNRRFEGKEYGYVIDYRGISTNLGEALDLYNSLNGFDVADLDGTLTDVRKIIDTLPQAHAVLISTFNPCSHGTNGKKKRNIEQYIRLLDDEELRLKFYERFTGFAKTLGIALSNADFLQTQEKKVEYYKKELEFFKELRLSVRRRYAEIIDFSEYEARIRKLLDTHLQAGETEIITGRINLTDVVQRQKLMNMPDTSEAKAETIANNLKRVISERWESDPALYKRFSEMLNELISNIRAGRLQSVAALQEAEKAEKIIVQGMDETVPVQIQHKPLAVAFYHNIRNDLCTMMTETDCAALADQLQTIIQKHQSVHWKTHSDILKQIEQELDDTLFENGITDVNTVDKIINQCLNIAKHH
ncbi:MAG: type I restriction endonuclease subunit R [Planctomycetaceae bacterium]|jgi:type I restriction enzyme R subunit|nr:type I restriction endonuclease subunit R [Planctomycetaceae bacterium]